MKNWKLLISAVALILAVSTPAFAKKFKAEEVTLKDTAGTVISAYELTSGAAVYTSAVTINENVGFLSVLITEDKAGGAGDVDISAEYSIDGTNFYTVATTDMAGTITDEGNIATAFGNQTRLIPFTARLAKFLRLKLDPDADSQVTATLLYQEEY